LPGLGTVQIFSRNHDVMQQFDVIRLDVKIVLALPQHTHDILSAAFEYFHNTAFGLAAIRPGEELNFDGVAVQRRAHVFL
jgi:hypothetical protein